MVNYMIRKKHLGKNLDVSCSFKSFLLVVIMMIVTTSSSLAKTSFAVINEIRYALNQETKTATVLPKSSLYFGRIAIPSSVKDTNGIEYTVTELGDNCFSGCSGLTSVTIPSTVNKLGWNCFGGCEKLRNVVVPGGVKEIGEGCFKGCSNLSSISIPSSVTSFRDNSFSGCEKLSVITLPTSVSKLGVSCFKNCNNLDTLYFKGAMPIGIVDAEIPTTCRIMVPNEHLDTYKEELSSDYRYLEAWNPDDSDEYATEQCATPSVTYEAGKLRFSCATSEVKYHYTITDDDIVTKAANKEGEVSLTAAYNISVYASAKGYRLSDTANATLYWLGNEADATNINHVEIRGIMASADRGIVTVYGLKTGETAKFFTVDGQLIGTSVAVDGVASCAVSESLVIIKVGKYSLKLMVQKN